MDIIVYVLQRSCLSEISVKLFFMFLSAEHQLATDMATLAQVWCRRWRRLQCPGCSVGRRRRFDISDEDRKYAPRSVVRFVITLFLLHRYHNAVYGHGVPWPRWKKSTVSCFAHCWESSASASLSNCVALRRFNLCCSQTSTEKNIFHFFHVHIFIKNLLFANVLTSCFCSRYASVTASNNSARSMNLQQFSFQIFTITDRFFKLQSRWTAPPSRARTSPLPICFAPPTWPASCVCTTCDPPTTSPPGSWCPARPWWPCAPWTTTRPRAISWPRAERTVAWRCSIRGRNARRSRSCRFTKKMVSAKYCWKRELATVVAA